MFVFIKKRYPENLAFFILGVLELFIRKVCEIFVYKHTETIEYVKKVTYFLRKMQTSRENNLRDFLGLKMRNFQGSIFI